MANQLPITAGSKMIIANPRDFSQNSEISHRQNYVRESKTYVNIVYCPDEFPLRTLSSELKTLRELSPSFADANSGPNSMFGMDYNSTERRNCQNR
jgi:hypothetical protein